MAADGTNSRELEQLKARLQETEDTLDAIRQGRVDALVVGQREQQQVFTLQSADYTYRVLVESVSQGALTVTDSGTILYSNKQFSAIVNQPLERIIGASLDDVLPLAGAGDVRTLFTTRHKPGKPYIMEYQLPDDNRTSLLVSASLLPAKAGEAYMSIVVTDITERKWAERAKDEFIALASHQLRTPATGVKQYLGMLPEGFAGALDEQQRAFIRTAYDSNERQISIISGILKTAQVDSGMFVLRKSPQNLAALVDLAVADFKPLFIMRSQRLAQAVPDSLEVSVDAAEFAVVLSNLIENASKYSPDDTVITIRGRQTAASVSLSVTDQGVGIKKADQARVFEKFIRVDNPMSDTVSGSGLGLYWTKRIITLHGGSLTVSSIPGKGTTFTVKLPR